MNSLAQRNNESMNTSHLSPVRRFLRLPAAARRFWCALGLIVIALSAPLPAARAANAAPPDSMTYQGFLVDANGAMLAPNNPANYPVVFRIYDAATGGALLWTEQQIVTIDKGNFSVLLGEGSTFGSETRGPLSAVFSGATASDRFIGITVTIGNTPTEILPRLRLLPAPYAFLAKQANSLVGENGTPLVVAGSGNQLTVAGKVTANAFQGTGADLVSLNADNITTGTLPDGRLSSNIPRLGRNQQQTFDGPISAPSFTGNGTIPVGGIIMWSGNTAPQGWALCDGGNGTPDLRGRFVLGSGNGPGLTGRGLGQKGGEEAHVLTQAEMPAHTHGIAVGTAGYSASYNGSVEVTSVPGGRNNGWRDFWGTSSVGGNAAHNTMPPYYVLAFIMRTQ